MYRLWLLVVLLSLPLLTGWMIGSPAWAAVMTADEAEHGVEIEDCIEEVAAVVRRAQSTRTRPVMRRAVRPPLPVASVPRLARSVSARPTAAIPLLC